jgi:hypothetical protein
MDLERFLNKSIKKAKEEINTCFVCNQLNVVSKHYGELICNTCYHLCQRIQTRYKKEHAVGMDRDELLTKAITRREELKESGKWEKQNLKDKMPNIRIGILK